jgi:hypothetical protein
MSIYLALKNYGCMACGLAFKRGAFSASSNELAEIREFVRNVAF